MEKIFKLSKLSKYPINYNIESLGTPIKINPNKYKENILNTFLQDIEIQTKQNSKYNIPINQKQKDSESEKIKYNQFIERKGKYSNNTNTCKKLDNHYLNRFSSNIIFSAHKTKNKNNKNENNRKYKILNPFKERSSSSSKSILIPTNENQISIFKNKELINSNKNKICNNSFISEPNENKKLKRNNTVYIKKHLSKEKNIKNKNNGDYLEIYKKTQKKIDTNSFKFNKKIMPRANSSAFLRKKEKENIIDSSTNTHNINSNVNIFNFDMNYNNAPNYYIKNSKMYNPYFNNYLHNNLGNENSFNIKSIKNKNLKNNFNESYNNSFIKMENSEERNYDNDNKMEEQIIEQSAIIIQSVYRGCIIRFQINNLLKAYKGIEVLSHFFKRYFWSILKTNINCKSNYFNNDIDSKMSISSISCISALFNSNNKNFILKSFNSKSFKEVRESFFILNPTSNNYNYNSKNIKYLDTFQGVNNFENKKNKALVWNKKKISKNYTPHKTKSKIKEYPLNNNIYNIKYKSLKIIVMKYINNTNINLYKFFMKFYLNGLLCKNENINNNNDLIKKQKLEHIIYNKDIKNKKILKKYFNRFNFRGVLHYMENHWYYINNWGRLYDISQNMFFIYEPKKFENGNNILNQNVEMINIGITLKKIKILKNIIFQKRKMTKERIRIYFYKFHFYGIIHYMKKELTKRIISKRLIMQINEKENKIVKDEQIKSQKIKILKRLINNKTKIYNNICKNIFIKWNLKTKIFSMIAIDKEKKKKRRIKKRNNKKLGTNISCNNNININPSSNKNNNINNINEKINNNSNKENPSINLEKEGNKKIELNYFIEHSNSVIYLNNIKITDYHKLNKFIEKINLIITRKFYFFNIILNSYKKIKHKNEEYNKNKEEIDFFIEDSSENSEIN